MSLRGKLVDLRIETVVALTAGTRLGKLICRVRGHHLNPYRGICWRCWIDLSTDAAAARLVGSDQQKGISE